MCKWENTKAGHKKHTISAYPSSAKPLPQKKYNKIDKEDLLLSKHRKLRCYVGMKLVVDYKLATPLPFPIWILIIIWLIHEVTKQSRAW